MSTFEFYRFRFHFRCLEGIYFPHGKSANLVRGAFGSLLRGSVPAAAYARIFRPGAALGDAPSGLADWPRPFVIRAGHLDGWSAAAGGRFFFDIHVFDLRTPLLRHFRRALAGLAERGIGPGRGRAELERVEQLSLQDTAQLVVEDPLAPSILPLDPDAADVERLLVRFLTATELKSGGELADQPEFPILFARLRDRLSTLRALYGAGPLPIDFRAMAERAADIRLGACRLNWEHRERKSARTGQVHPLGGFTGEVEYLGALSEFAPWIRAARWTGVGRQTVWGKGDVRVLPC